MLRTRIIPCLQVRGDSLVKTVRFGKFGYVGDPINTVRIFNELEVDELCFVDIRATVEKRAPNLPLLAHIATEAFMPLAYSGGIRDLDTARQVLGVGVEKVVVNTAACEEPSFVSRLAERFGSQSVIGSIDVRRGLLGGYQVYSHAGTRKTGLEPVEWAAELQRRGAGELLLTSMDRDGTWSGFDLDIVRSVARAVDIPVIASGGAGTLRHIGLAVNAGASAVALGSMVVYQGKGMGVLVNFPDRAALAYVLEGR